MQDSLIYEEFRKKLIWFVVFSLALGIYSNITIFASISLHGWVTEEVTDRLKVRALRNILRQGAEYFDYPETSNAKLLQRITNDNKTLKAVKS
jgi:hypothetical protein